MNLPIEYYFQVCGSVGLNALLYCETVPSIHLKSAFQLAKLKLKPIYHELSIRPLPPAWQVPVNLLSL